jgi:hypothetical protein
MTVVADEPVTPPAPALPLTPEQLAAIVAEGRAVLADVQHLAAIIAMVRGHNVAGLVGELRAAFSALVPSQP